MTQTSEASMRVSPFQLLRMARDRGMESWARVALTVTSSGAYSRATAALAKPGLIVTALVRTKTDELMSRLLARVNMPSRGDVLALSVRLTHIELTLDDLGAAIDELRAAAGAGATTITAKVPAAAPAPAKRAPRNGRGPRRDEAGR